MAGEVDEQTNNEETTSTEPTPMEGMVAEVVEGLGLGEETPAEEQIQPGVEEEEAAAGSPETAPPEGSVAKPAPAKAESAPGSPPPAEGPKVPDSWTPEAKAEWAKLPPRIQQEIAKREQDVIKGFGQLNNLAGIGQAFGQAAQPFMATFKQHNIDPAQHASRLFNIHAQLAFGQPAQKAAIIGQLMREFNVSPEMLAGGEAPYVDPQVQALTSRFETLQSAHQQLVDSQRQAAYAQREAEVVEFAKTHEHFEAVGADIARLIESKAATTLQQAYDMAIWASPAVRQKMLDAQEAARKAAETAARSERAKKAQASTAANVRASTKPRGPTVPKGSIDETLNSVADKLFAE